VQLQSWALSNWNVAKIYKISGQIGQLIGKAVPLERVDMLAKATKDARAEAGAAIGAITNADTGSFQITSPN